MNFEKRLGEKVSRVRWWEGTKERGRQGERERERGGGRQKGIGGKRKNINYILKYHQFYIISIILFRALPMSKFDMTKKKKKLTI